MLLVRVILLKSRKDESLIHLKKKSFSNKKNLFTCQKEQRKRNMIRYQSNAFSIH